MELSVIIPIYKTELYVQSCIDSILEHPSRDIEIILVDDGSPDRCPEICDTYEKSDGRIVVIHKENGGLSSARNAGLSIASGRYITFVDSDDLICSDSIPKILEWIRTKEADICFLQTDNLFPDGTRSALGECILGDNLRGKSREEAVRYLASRPKYPGSAWAKLYRREFLINNDLHFPYDRRYSEDLGFVRDCILNAQSFDALDIPYYLYRKNRQGSITNQVKTQNFFDLLVFITESCDKLTVNKKAKDLVSSYAMGFVAYEYSVLLYLYNRIPEQDRKLAFNMMKRYKWTLRYGINKKGRLILIIGGLGGVRFTSFLMKVYGEAVGK